MHALFGYFHKFLEMTDVQYMVITDAANLKFVASWCCKLSANVCLGVSSFGCVVCKYIL